MLRQVFSNLGIAYCNKFLSDFESEMIDPFCMGEESTTSDDHELIYFSAFSASSSAWL